MLLEKIISMKKKEVARQKKKVPLKKFQKKLKKSDHVLKKALKKDGLHIIGEIKKATIKEGIIRKRFNPSALAKQYQKAGVAAISVLTDTKHFKGSLNDLIEVRKATKLPVIRKDFIIDTYQVYEARKAGADAVLLIASALSIFKMIEILNVGFSLGMDAIVEIHNEKDLKKVMQTGADIIGINNRNLRTLEVNIDTTLKLARQIPEDRVIVSESGFKTKQDLKKVQGKVQAVLIGTTFMKAPDLIKKVKQLKV